MLPTEYTYPENINHVNKRVKTFFKKIINNHCLSDDKIIVSTHQGVCNNILKIILHRYVS